MIENQITIVDENGEDIVCEILFTFDGEGEYAGSSYVVYFPVTQNNNDEEVLELMASKFIQNNVDQGELLPIENDEEWAKIEELIATFEEGDIQ